MPKIRGKIKKLVTVSEVEMSPVEGACAHSEDFFLLI
jgi:hypothetical protein